MHTAEDGPERQSVEAVPRPLDEKHRVELDLIPWETRSVDNLNAVAAGPARFEVWMRTPAVDGDLAPALTASSYAQEALLRFPEAADHLDS